MNYIATLVRQAVAATLLKIQAAPVREVHRLQSRHQQNYCSSQQQLFVNYIASSVRQQPVFRGGVRAGRVLAPLEGEQAGREE